MKTALWLLVTLASLASFASPVSAQTGTVGGAISSHGSPAVDRRNFQICLVADIQNQTSMSDEAVANASVDCSQTVGAYCTGASCTSSPYCYVSWWNTGEILLRNEAYSLTGQHHLIDYSRIKGGDNVASRLPNQQDHDTCDLIIGLGDSMDTCDVATLANATATQLHEYNAALMFWTIIKNSGIPYIVARGNHESESIFASLMTALDYANEPFVTAEHADGDQYAITVTTGIGISLCAITMDYDDATSLTASEITWITTNTGCGSDLPTILTSHELVCQGGGVACDNGAADGALSGHGDTLIASAANDEIFIAAGGHWVVSTPVSTKSTELNVGGKVVHKFFSNWQQLNRHNQNIGGTGITSSDGMGGIYTVIDLQPGRDRLCAHDWNPYWQSQRAESSNGQDWSGVLTSSFCEVFDFDARYGL